MKNVAFLLLIYNSLTQQTGYVRNTIARIIASVCVLFLQLFAWRALYSSIGFSDMMGRSYETMVTYVLVISLVSELTYGGGVSRMLEARMKSGEIALDMLRPLSPRGLIVAESWGGKALGIFISLITIAVGAALSGGLRLPPSPAYGAMFAAALVMGYLVDLMFELLMSMFAFWFVSVNTLQWFVSFFALSMSGAIVPLWLLPGWLKLIATALPFQATAYIPMQLYLGEIRYGDAWGAFALQAAWVLGLGILGQILWKKGVRRIVVHGG